MAGVVEALGPAVDQWHLAGLPGAGDRAQAAEALAARLAGTAAGGAPTHESVADALVAARGRARPGDRILVLGSFHTAAAALDWLDRD